MTFSKCGLWLLSLLFIGTFVLTLASPLLEEEANGLTPHNTQEGSDETGTVVDEEDYDGALAKNFISKLGEGVNQVSKNVEKLVKKEVKYTIKGVGQVEKVVKEGGKQVLKGSKQGSKKVIKKKVRCLKWKKGKCILFQVFKETGKVVQESAAEVAVQVAAGAVLNQALEDGGEIVKNDEEMEIEKGIYDEEADEEVEEKTGGEEEEEEVDLFDNLVSDDLCKFQDKKCVCCAEIPEYKLACLHLNVLTSLWEDNSEVRVEGFYGKEKAVENQFPGNKPHKKCETLSKSMGNTKVCISSNGVKSIDKAKNQCFKLEFNDERSFVKCISQAENFKLSINL